MMPGQISDAKQSGERGKNLKSINWELSGYKMFVLAIAAVLAYFSHPYMAIILLVPCTLRIDLEYYPQKGGIDSKDAR